MYDPARRWFRTRYTPEGRVSRYHLLDEESDSSTPRGRCGYRPPQRYVRNGNVTYADATWVFDYARRYPSELCAHCEADA